MYIKNSHMFYNLLNSLWREIKKRLKIIAIDGKQKEYIRKIDDFTRFTNILKFIFVI